MWDDDDNVIANFLQYKHCSALPHCRDIPRTKQATVKTKQNKGL